MAKLLRPDDPFHDLIPQLGHPSHFPSSGRMNRFTIALIKALTLSESLFILFPYLQGQKALSPA